MSLGSYFLIIYSNYFFLKLYLLHPNILQTKMSRSIFYLSRLFLNTNKMPLDLRLSPQQLQISIFSYIYLITSENQQSYKMYTSCIFVPSSLFHYIKQSIEKLKLKMSSQLQQKSLQYKNLGNQRFKQKNYEEAIQFYSQAIQIFPTSIYYSNRSRAYLNLGDFENSYKDSQKAVQLDDKNIKGYYLMGQSLVQIANNSKNPEKIHLAIEKLSKSLTLCPGQGRKQYQQHFINEIYRAKKNLWELKRQDNELKKKALRSYLTNLVQTDDQIDSVLKDQLSQKLQKLLDKNVETQKIKVPDALVCPITGMLLKDPVCNEHGNSYSKKAYLEAIQLNGKVDPLTKQPITTQILYTNLNLKKAIQHFLERHPWAFDQKISN